MTENNSKSPLHQLSALGQSVWIDNLTRKMVKEGELERLMRKDSVTGVTSNPTIFQKAIAEGDAYDEQLRGLASKPDATEVFIALASEDVRDACDLLRPVWDEGKGQDGYVSMEVDPTYAFKTGDTLDQAMRFFELIDRPNLLVKIPATKPGLPAIEECIARGKSINVTLIFSLERYKEVVEAYLRGLERLVEAGGDPSTVASVASFFISRVDTEADRRLDDLSRPELKGQLAIANARLAYQHFLEAFSGPRWDALEAKEATKQRCLWASTSVKNPDMKDTTYVEELIGPETVNTMPAETIKAFQDHGVVAETITRGAQQAEDVIRDLARVGVDYDEVVETIEMEGVQKFIASFEELLAGIRQKQAELRG
jgi:transaldolase